MRKRPRTVAGPIVRSGGGSGTYPAPLRTGGFFGSYTLRGRSELKVIENAVATQLVANTGTIVAYNLVAQGTDFTNRVGRKILVKSVLWRATCYPAAVNNYAGDIIRCMLVWDYQPNSAAAVPNVTDVLTTADIFSGVNLNNRDRFKVLYDKRFLQNPAAYAGGVLGQNNAIVQYKEKYMKCNLEQIFSGTGGTIGNIGTGALLFLVISQNTNATNVNHYCRVRFTDQ